MSDCIPGVPEVIEAPGTNVLDWRTRCLSKRSSAALGQMDLCRLTKVTVTKKSFFGEISVERQRYFHFVANLCPSSPQTLVHYLNGLISAQEKEGSESGGWKTVRVESASICVFDAVHQLDIRLDLDVAAGNRITILTVDAVSGQPSSATIQRSAWDAAAFSSALRCVRIPETLPCLRLLAPSVNVPELIKKSSVRFLSEAGSLAPEFILAIDRFFTRRCLFKPLLAVLEPLRALEPGLVFPLLARAYAAGGEAAAALASLAHGIQEFPDFRAAFLAEQARLLTRMQLALALRAAHLAVECAPGNFQANLALARTCLAGEEPEKTLLALNLACACLDEAARKSVEDERRFWEDLEQTVPETRVSSADAALDVQLFTKPKNFEMLREASSEHLIREEQSFGGSQPCAQIGPHDFGYFKEIVGVDSLGAEEKTTYKVLVALAKKTQVDSETVDAWVKRVLANRSISSSLVSLLELLRLDLLRLAQWRDDPNERAAVVWTARTALAYRLQLLDEVEIAGRLAQSLWPCPRVWLLVAKSFLKRGALPEFLDQLERVHGAIAAIGNFGDSLEYTPPWLLEVLAKAVSRHGLSAVQAVAGDELPQANYMLDKIRALQSDGCHR